MTRVALDGGGELAVPLASDRVIGARVSLVVRAEDVLLAREAPRGLSARNVLPATVVACARVGADVTVRCALPSGLPVLARLTPSALKALAIAPESAIWLAVKSHSVGLT